MAKGGVYEILNTTNSKRYVGSAANLPRRKKEHLRRLRGNKHHNRYLQRSWNKYGEKVFKFDVIEYWEPEFLVSMEQWWMNMLQPEYNIAPVAGSPLGVTHTAETRAKMSEAHMGTTLSEETKNKISNALMGNTNGVNGPGFIGKHTAESKAKMSAALKGKKRGTPSEETKAKISAAMKGNVPWNRGKPGHKNTAETRAKLSAALKGKPWSPARRAAEDARQAKNNTKENDNG